MSNRIMFFIICGISILVANVVLQFFFEGRVDIWRILGVLTGVVIAAILYMMLHNKTKYSQLLWWVALVLSAITVPVIIVGFVTFIFNLLSIHITPSVLFGLYVLGVLTILMLILRYGQKVLKNPQMDERYMQHISWAGFWSFIMLMLCIIGALIQPWVALNETGLWVSVIVAGFLFWFIFLIILEWKR